MEEGAICVAIVDSKPETETELKFTSGDYIKVLKSEGDWYFGECLNTKKQGYYDPKSCHRICEPLNYTSFRNASDRKKLRDSGLHDIIKSEQDYTSSQRDFVDIVVKQLLLRDTHFKRTILGDPAFAVCVTLLQDILNATLIFLSELQHATTNEKIAESYLRFAPSLQLFAQFASENSNALNTLKQHEKPLNAFMKSNPLPDNISMEYCFIMPLQQFKRYRTNLQAYVILTDPAEPGFFQLMNAMYAIVTQTDDVDARLKDEESNLQLLGIQNQFAGSTSIFKQGRRLIREGAVERIRHVKEEVDVKSYYIHLFNDCLIYSTKKSNALGYHYKLKKSLDLSTLNAAMEPEASYNMMNVLTLVNVDDPDFSISFRFIDDVEAMEWLQHITSLSKHDTSKKDRRQIRASAAATTSIPGVNPATLGPRASCVYTFLQAEIPFADSIWQMYSVLIKPLINSSKGATLEAGMISLNHDDDSSNAKAKDNTRRASTINKGQVQQVTDSLQDADVQVFLRAAEGLALSLQDFAASIEAQCKQANWSENIAIGPIFSSSSANALFNQYKSYASGQEATLRALRSYAFTSFYVEAEVNLLLGRGKLLENIELTRRRVEYYLKFIQELTLVTPPSHNDYKSLNTALEKLNLEANEVSEVIRNRMNFDKLLDIQKGFSTVSVFGPDPFVSKIASFDRTFIKEGELKKVCRKKNKAFKFWLFNDYLIYGEYAGNNSYTFHRFIDLTKCTVAEHRSAEVKDAFEIFGTEKSFIVIAKNATIQQEWIAAISKAIEAIRPADMVASTAVAPLWVPDSVSDKCAICMQGFTMWRRRHHCRQCGACVCGEHSSHNVVLTYINDTKKQRVCDTCYNNQNFSSSYAARASESIKKESSMPTTLPPPITSSPPPIPHHVDNKSKVSHATTVHDNAKQDHAPERRNSMPMNAPPPIPIPTSAPPPVPGSPSLPPPKPQRGMKAPPKSPPRSPPAVPTTSAPAPTPDQEAIPRSIVSNNLAAFQTKPAERQTSPMPKSEGGSSIKVRLQAYQSNAETTSATISSASRSPTASPQKLRTTSPKPEPVSEVGMKKPAIPAKHKHVAAEPTTEPPPSPDKAPEPVVKATLPQPARGSVSPSPSSTASSSSSVDDESSTSVQKRRVVPPPKRDDEPPAVSPRNQASSMSFPPSVNEVAAKDPPPVPAPIKRVVPPPAMPPTPAPAAIVLVSDEVEIHIPPPSQPSNPSPSIPQTRAPPPPPPSRPGPPPPRPPPPKSAPVEEDVSSSVLNPDVDDGLGKYRKLKQFMPEAAVRQRMLLDGFSVDQIDEFLSTNTIGGDGNSNMTTISIPAPPPMPTLAKSQPSEDPMLTKYRKLKDSLPADAVRQKMRMDGVDANDIDRFLAGEMIERLTINKASSSPLGLDLASVTLKSAPQAEHKPKARRASILDEIQSGAKLKSVQKDDTRMKPAVSNAAGGLLGNLAVEMFKRRVNMRQDEDIDSDGSGFSESDSDSD